MLVFSFQPSQLVSPTTSQQTKLSRLLFQTPQNLLEPPDIPVKTPREIDRHTVKTSVTGRGRDVKVRGWERGGREGGGGGLLLEQNGFNKRRRQSVNPMDLIII